jgi:hypothetical protein
MVMPPDFNPFCEEDRQKCACYASAKAGKRIGKVIVNPKSPTHVALCLVSVTTCLVAWTAYAGPKINPKLETLAVPLASACMYMDALTSEYEVS